MRKTGKAGGCNRIADAATVERAADAVAQGLMTWRQARAAHHVSFFLLRQALAARGLIKARVMSDAPVVAAVEEFLAGRSAMVEAARAHGVSDGRIRAALVARGIDPTVYSRELRLGTVAERLLGGCEITEDCWLLSRPGRHGIQINGVWLSYKRAAFQTWVRAPRPERIVVSRCGNARCIKPEHLMEIARTGERRMYARSMSIANRLKQAEALRRKSRLSDAQVQEIRDLAAITGIGPTELGRRYGIHRDHAARILNMTTRVPLDVMRSGWPL